MSSETKTALDTAIAAHFADVCGGAIVHGYLLQIHGDSLEDMAANQWSALRETSDGQSFITTLGLIHYAKRSTEVAMSEYAGDDD